MKKILMINGPNLNLLGTREVEIYGQTTLKEIEDQAKKVAQNHGYVLSSFQSNHEGELIDKIHASETDFIIINPAGLTHTSVSLRDALIAKETPFIEVHLSNLMKREQFRHKSLFSDIAYGTISGFGYISYDLALNAAIDILNKNNKAT